MANGGESTRVKPRPISGGSTREAELPAVPGVAWPGGVARSESPLAQGLRRFRRSTTALVVDGVALWAIAARISEFGFTPNRVAALGENLILLVNLAWTAWLYASFLRHRGSFAVLERWQIAYLPVYSVWAALVVVMFPPVFGYR